MFLLFSSDMKRKAEETSEDGPEGSPTNPAELARLNAISAVFKNPSCFVNQSDAHKRDEGVALAAVSSPAATVERAVLGISWMQAEDKHLTTLMSGFYAHSFDARCDKQDRKKRGLNLGVVLGPQTKRLVMAAVRNNGSALELSALPTTVVGPAPSPSPSPPPPPAAFAPALVPSPPVPVPVPDAPPPLASSRAVTWKMSGHAHVKMNASVNSSMRLSAMAKALEPTRDPRERRMWNMYLQQKQRR